MACCRNTHRGTVLVPSAFSSKPFSSQMLTWWAWLAAQPGELDDKKWSVGGSGLAAAWMCCLQKEERSEGRRGERSHRREVRIGGVEVGGSVGLEAGSECNAAALRFHFVLFLK